MNKCDPKIVFLPSLHDNLWMMKKIKKSQECIIIGSHVKVKRWNIMKNKKVWIQIFQEENGRGFESRMNLEICELKEEILRILSIVNILFRNDFNESILPIWVGYIFGCCIISISCQIIIIFVPYDMITKRIRDKRQSTSIDWHKLTFRFVVSLVLIVLKIGFRYCM